MTASAGERARAIRHGVGLFTHDDRALIEVTGGDRVRWLQGQISNDVAALEPGQGCYATVLTVKGRIIADLHVLAREDRFWIATGAAARTAVIERLERYIVADDVALHDASDAYAWFSLEGGRTAEVIEAAANGELPPEEWAAAVRIAERDVLVWRFAASNLAACQLVVPAADAEAVRAALLAAGAKEEDRDVLEVLRIESGVPALGSELDEEVFPAEARLHHAISTTKGCYTGQEIVERIRSRGQVNHLLVGLRFPGSAPAVGSELFAADGKRVGEVTSVAASAELGAIGLGYVRREHEADGSELRSEAGPVRVARLPFLEGADGS